MRSELEQKAERLLERCEFLALSSVTKEGYPRSCTMAKMKAEGYDTIWFSTGTGSMKTGEFAGNPKAGVCYWHEGDSVTLMGDVEIVHDMETKQSLWSDWLYDHFPKGVEDPEYTILKFTTREAVIWIDFKFERFSYR